MIAVYSVRKKQFLLLIGYRQQSKAEACAGFRCLVSRIQASSEQLTDRSFDSKLQEPFRNVSSLCYLARSW